MHHWRSIEEIDRVISGLQESLGAAKFNEDYEETEHLKRLISSLEDERDLYFVSFTHNRCSSCHTEINTVAGIPDNGFQYDNALILKFKGGYGMFVESTDFYNQEKWDQEHTVILCHECAHELCERYPWANFVVGPRSSHSHTQEYHDKHPDHKGWDYEIEGGE